MVKTTGNPSRRPFKDYSGTLVGLWKVIRPGESRGRHYRLFVAPCPECGNEMQRSIQAFKTIRHCGDCEQRSKKDRIHDLKGQIFGRWKVLYLSPDRKQGGGVKWVCECVCVKHTIKTVDALSLTSGNSRSCGCITAELKHPEIIALARQLGVDRVTAHAIATVNINNDIEDAMIGRRFYSLVVIGTAGRGSGGVQMYWVRCQCADDSIAFRVSGSELRRGKIRRCRQNAWCRKNIK